MHKIYEIQIPRSINEDLLEQSQTHVFIYRLWLLSHYIGRVSGHDRHHMACKASSIYYLDLYRKRFNPSLVYKI